MPIIHLEDGIPPSKSRMVTMGGIFNDIVNSFTSHVETFTPPKGKKWQVIGMRLTKGAPTGATIGEHSFTLSQGGAAMLYGESACTDGLTWSVNRWSEATNSQAPTDEAASLLALHAMTADTNNPLIISYLNATDVQNSRLGEITIHVLESPVI